MALTPLTIRQRQLIVASFRKVFQTGDISHLSKSAYNFIYLASGFIAHYNLYGFRDEYRDVDYFKQRILANLGPNQWKNFRPGERDYDYNMAKRDTYNAIAEEIINVADDKDEMREQVEQLKNCGWMTRNDVYLC